MQVVQTVQIDLQKYRFTALGSNLAFVLKNIAHNFYKMQNGHVIAFYKIIQLNTSLRFFWGSVYYTSCYNNIHYDYYMSMTNLGQKDSYSFRYSRVRSTTDQVELRNLAQNTLSWSFEHVHKFLNVTRHKYNTIYSKDRPMIVYDTLQEI